VPRPVLISARTSFPFAYHDRFGVGVVGRFARFDFGDPWGYGDFLGIIEQVAPPSTAGPALSNADFARDGC
jgi:hypothetical protein